MHANARDVPEVVGWECCDELIQFATHGLESVRFGVHGNAEEATREHVARKLLYALHTQTVRGRRACRRSVTSSNRFALTTSRRSLYCVMPSHISSTFYAFDTRVSNDKIMYMCARERCSGGELGEVVAAINEIVLETRFNLRREGAQALRINESRRCKNRRPQAEHYIHVSRQRKGLQEDAPRVLREVYADK